jgi:hypothetical protein
MEESPAHGLSSFFPGWHVVRMLAWAQYLR